MIKKLSSNSEERLRPVKRHAGDFLPAGFDPHEAMRILAGYIQNLETGFDDFKKTASHERRQLEGECRASNKIRDDQKQEIDRLTNDLIELTNTLEDQESVLSTANQKIGNYEKQYKKLHRELSEMGNKLTQRENDANFYRTELDRCTKENEALGASLTAANHRIEDLERRLAVERETANLHEKDARRLNLILSESQGKNALLEKKLEETVIKFNEEIKRLTDRLNADALHEVSLLKKRVRSFVAPEMRDLSKLMADKLSIETAGNLRALLIRILAKMEQAGVSLT